MLYQSSELFSETDWGMFYDVTVACWMEQWRPRRPRGTQHHGDVQAVRPRNPVQGAGPTYAVPQPDNMLSSSEGPFGPSKPASMLSGYIFGIETSHWDSYVKYLWHIALSRLYSSGLWWPGWARAVNSSLRLLQYECFGVCLFFHYNDETA